MKFFLGLVFILLSGCNYNRSKLPTEGPENGPGANKPGGQETGALDFATVKSVVLGPRCLSCHMQYKDYSEVKANIDKIRFRVLVARNMPLTGLRKSESNILASWIDQGAPEFADPNSKPEPDPEPTPEPTPSPIPEPTPTPSPKPSPAPNPSPAPEPSSQGLSPLDREQLLEWFDLEMPE